jgi:redox-sensitive bicupin YhaK (pirin superfamily)
VSWLFDGLVLHRDSLGSEQLVRPGELNLMTSGRGIAHSEESPAGRPARLHGVQLWIALPAGRDSMEPDFAHHADLPVVPVGDAQVTVAIGELAGERSPAMVHTPLVGLEVALPAGGTVILATREDFEYGVLAADGPATVAAAGNAGTARIEPGTLAHLSTGNNAIELSAAGPSRFFVVGGTPLGERLVMWWNFVARSAEEIASARLSWVAQDGRFGMVRGYAGDPLPAPTLPSVTLKPR